MNAKRPTSRKQTPTPEETAGARCADALDVNRSSSRGSARPTDPFGPPTLQQALLALRDIHHRALAIVHLTASHA